MSETVLKTVIQLRRGTTAEWLENANVIPAAGEPCLDLDTGLVKYGDGTTTYGELEYSGGTGSQASHYEGVKQDGETDTDVFTRVLSDIGATVQKDDIFVVKALIADGKYSYTAYVYDGTVWAAMDGNYSAENVYFPSDLTYTANIGVLTVPSSGSGTIEATGKSVKDVFASILAKEKNPGKSDPAVTLNCAQMGAYEVGTKVTPTYSASLSAGSYTYGPATGIVATAWSVSDGTKTLETASGTFDELTVGDTTNYSITATATHGEGAVPVTNIGNPYAAGKIAAGSKSATKSKISGYRNSFYGTKETSDDAVDSALIRTLTASGKALANGSSFNLSIPVGAKRIMFAYPATLRDVTSVLDVNGMNAEIVSTFAPLLQVVSVEGANGYDAIDYKVYVYDIPNANDTANTYKVTI